jgi:uncharacterized membrane protein
MDLYLALKLLHVLSSTVLFGTGMGIAFFMWMAHRTGAPTTIAHTARVVVIADAVFTATAVVVQPLTGFALMVLLGYPLREPWIAASLVLFVGVGACWLPVVWIQAKMRDLAHAAAQAGTGLPERYHRLFRVWFALGWPAFIGVVAIFVLMIAKPVLW